MLTDVDQFSDFDPDDIDEISRLADAAEGTHLEVVDIEDYEPPHGLRLPASSPLEHNLISLPSPRQESSEPAPPPEVAPENDTRSPLERFRRPPKKALSVTDLVSPAWCELQYWYTLTRHGRKRRTPAMKQGTSVHKALEEEVHVTVPITTPSKEDGWGLRVWNIIQGIRTLRDTGFTREMEVWGTVGGEIVNGVIDEISYTCPDPNLESKVDKQNFKNPVAPDLPERQTSITDFLAPASQQENGQSLEAALGPGQPPKEKRIYVTDIKTRGSKTLPALTAMRPAILQLHLYHHMLENLAQGNLSLQQLAERYGLDITAAFSDEFIAQVGSLNQEMSELRDSQDSLDILLEHNNLSSLWSYMLGEFRETFFTSAGSELPTSTPQSVADLPAPQAQPTRLSPILTVEYLSATYEHRRGESTHQHSLGRKSFVFNAPYLKAYLEDSLTWWHGEREAKGVELQEAWKCRSCDFRNDCVWIHDRDQAAFDQAMDRKTMRAEAYGTKSAV